MSIPFQTYFALLAIVALIILIQGRLYLSAANWMQRRFWKASGSGRMRKILGGIFVLLNLPWLLLIALAADDNLEVWIALSNVRVSAARWVMYPFSIWQTSGIAIWLVLSALDAFRWIARRFETMREAGPAEMAPGAPFNHGRREWLQAAGTGLVALPFAASSYGAIAASRSYAVERPEIFIPGWPKELDGLRIAQLTDIHVGLFMTEERVREVVQVVNRLEADLVALTGDFVSSSRAYVAPCVRALAGLRARHGVYACVGNHDVFTESIGALDEGFRAENIRLLYDERESLLIGGAWLHLIGIDFIRQDGRFGRIMRGMPISPGTILLSHQPSVFPSAAERGIPLQLSGHTHGGQVRFEILGEEVSPARLMTRFVRGSYEINQSRLYVSRGVGTTGPPVRLNAPPEITLLTLRSA